MVLIDFPSLDRMKVLPGATNRRCRHIKTRSSRDGNIDRLLMDADEWWNSRERNWLLGDLGGNRGSGSSSEVLHGVGWEGIRN